MSLATVFLEISAVCQLPQASDTPVITESAWRWPYMKLDWRTANICRAFNGTMALSVKKSRRSRVIPSLGVI